MRYSTTLATILLTAATAAADPTPDTQVISLDDAIKLALEHQPTLRQSRAAVEQALGRVDSARVITRPTVSLSASATVGSTWWATTCAVGGGMCGGFLDPTVTTGLGASASWRITDFGQTAANIHAAEASAEATRATLGGATLDARQAVEAAYLEAVARARLVTVAEATVKSEEVHLDQAKRFVAAQAKDPIEVAQAQARLANAKSALAQAQSSQATITASLRAAIGWLDGTRPIAVDPTWPEPPGDLPSELPALVDTARAHRPEIVALDKSILAANATLEASYAERRPILTAQASTTWGPGRSPTHTDWDPVPNWSAGVALSWALFDGGKAKADQRIAKAGVESALAQRDALLVSLASQLEAARAQIVANRANVAASTEAVAAARTQLQLAEARYAQGLGSQIELADAQTAVTTAEGNLILAQFQLADAWVSLRRQLGES